VFTPELKAPKKSAKINDTEFKENIEKNLPKSGKPNSRMQARES
jgi:hypothetical protein